MKRKKIGQQHHKPFPVVETRLRPETGGKCFQCKEDQAFAASFYGGSLSYYQTIQQDPQFSPKEIGELAWERAYRMQKAGHEEWSEEIALCFNHALGIVQHYMGNHDKASYVFLVKAVLTQETIFLYDRNLQRDMHHAAIASGHFHTIAEFRELFDAGVGVNLGAFIREAQP